MAVIEWEEPPDHARVGVYERFFMELRLHPGRWAVFQRDLRNPGGTINRLKQGKYLGIRRGELEVKSHRCDGLTTIYVRVRKGEG